MEQFEILYPQEFYAKELKQGYLENSEKLFEELLKKSNVNVEENRETVKKYDLAKIQVDKMDKKYRALKGWRIFFIIFSIIAIIAGVVSIVIACTTKDSPTIPIVVGVVSICLSISSFLFIILFLNKKVKSFKSLLDKAKEEADKLYNLALNQMLPLNSLFDWNAPSQVVKATSPIISLDPYFDVKKLDYLYSKYNFGEDMDPDRTTVMTLSGDIIGNPFFMHRTLSTEMGTKIYTGTLLITWTQVIATKEGTKTVTRTQTLTASVSKPCPYYHLKTTLVYGCDVATNLNFSRKPTVKDGMNDKSIQKMVKKGSKSIQKKMQKELMDNNPDTNFTAMSNETFDVLFNALDRNNEIEFRVLYTPIAQESTIRLLCESKPYGDDFEFYKRGPLNYICSAHSQSFDFSSNPIKYYSHSVDIAHKNFVSYNTDFIQRLYFDLAPLLCIPAYQQFKGEEHVFQNSFDSNYTSYEEETLANSFSKEVFMPEGSITQQILKIESRKKIGKSDLLNIRSYAYRGIEHVDFIPTKGGDGKWHNVPVKWIEYIPISKDTSLVVKEANKTNSEINSLVNSDTFSEHVKASSFVSQRGLCAFVVNGFYGEENDKDLTELLNK